MKASLIFLICMFGFYDSTSIKAVFTPPEASPSAKPRLMMKGTFPTLNEFTICHWVDLNVNNSDGNYIMAYGHQDNQNELLRTGVINGYFMMSIGDQLAYFVKRQFYDFDLKLGKWYHVCVSWSTGGTVTFYFHGKEMLTTKHIANNFVIKSGGQLIIGNGQDQDNATTAWHGNIADLHIWDEALQENQIKELANCKSKIEGNIFAWMKTPVEALDGVVLSGRTDLCV